MCCTFMHVLHDLGIISVQIFTYSILYIANRYSHTKQNSESFVEP